MPSPPREPERSSATAPATWDWAVTSDRVAYSAAWSALLGDDRGDSTASLHAWLGRVHPDDIAAVMHALDHHLGGTAPTFRAEHRLRAKSGTFRWVIAEGYAERDAAGHAVRLRGTLAEVTDRNRTDTLAGLPGLAALSAHVERLVARARSAPDHRFALLLVDLDRFGAVNALLGVDGGDVLLREALRRLARCLRDGDLVARLGVHDPQASSGDVALPPLGGDECTLVLSNLTDARDALRVAARVHDALAAPFPIAGHRLFASASIGIAMNSAAHDSAGDLLRDAHSALVRARARGPAETQLFDDQARASASEFMEFAADVEAGIAGGQFDLWFQPTIDLKRGRIVRAEALLRWKHPTRGLLRPNIFVPLLEQSGHLVPLGWDTIGAACRAVAAWDTAQPPVARLGLSVNLSSAQFLSPDLVARLTAAVHAAGLDAGRLELEMAELDVMADVERTVEVSQALRAAGFRVALDDFGLGLATTEHIRALGVHTLKIDRSYLGGNPQHGGSAAIVQYAIELAAILGIDVVAEGIETPSELQSLETLGCPAGQGFYFSRAVPDDELLALLRRDAAGDRGWWAGAAPSSTRRRRESDIERAVPTS